MGETEDLGEFRSRHKDSCPERTRVPNRPLDYTEVLSLTDSSVLFYGGWGYGGSPTSLSFVQHTPGLP